jgi:hypothetical protein
MSADIFNAAQVLIKQWLFSFDWEAEPFYSFYVV